MSKSKSRLSTLSGLIESDSEDGDIDQDPLSSPASAIANMPPAKTVRGKGKTAAKPIGKAVVGGRVTKSKAAPLHANKGDKVVPGKRGRRPALADKTNEQQGRSDTEEVDDFEQQEDTIMTTETVPSGDELDAEDVAAKHAPKVATKSKQKAKVVLARSRATRTRGEPMIQDTPETLQTLTSAVIIPKKQAKGRRKISPEPEHTEKIIQETQVSAMDVDDRGDEDIDELTPEPVSRTTKLARSSAQPRKPQLSHWRGGSASDTERNDPAVRRKLGELTKQLEKANLKYQTLRDKEMDAGLIFDRAKKQSEEAMQGLQAVNAQQKEELAANAAKLKELRGLKKRIATRDDEILELKAKVARLTTLLTESQTENKTLSTRLVANRNAAATVVSAMGKVPGSAVKVNGGIRLMGSAEAAEAAQAAQLKEDLYSDLTGLIIRGVKREPEEDVYDCIQTGRNGTLHFKLAVGNEKGPDRYDDAQCVYGPLLDASRDKLLIEMLPDYLVDEITFPRPQAGKFYARVVKALTEKSIE